MLNESGGAEERMSGHVGFLAHFLLEGVLGMSQGNVKKGSAFKAVKYPPKRLCSVPSDILKARDNAVSN